MEIDFLEAGANNMKGIFNMNHKRTISCLRTVVSLWAVKKSVLEEPFLVLDNKTIPKNEMSR